MTVLISQQATFTAMIFLILSLALAKSSLVLFITRLLALDSTKMRIACYTLVGIFTAWAVASIIAISVNYSPTSLIEDDSASRCGDQVRTSRFVILASN